MYNSAMCHISTDGEKFWPFFGVLPRKIPCGEPEILQFYLYGRQPLLSILKDRVGRSAPENYFLCVILDYSVVY